ncbi:MAG: YiaA/YiaB family inner membrane protein [Myxococcota bacterium]
MSKIETPGQHSAAWIAQAYLSFAVAFTVTAIGIGYLPVDVWIKAFLGMGLLFTVGSTVSLSKTLRDLHEEKKLTSRLDEVKIQRMLAEHNLAEP